MTAIQNRTDRAVSAAVAAGRDLGVECADPKVLHDVFSVVVHLAPAPVVVRVPTVLPPSARGPAQLDRQRAELAVAAWLAGTGFPVVPPSPLVPAEPVARDGFLMTFWQHVPVLDTEPDPVAQAARTAELHAALRAYPGELPFLSSLDASIDESFDLLAGRPDLLAPADLARVRAQWAALAPLLTDRAAFERAFPDAAVQALHGDSPPWNMLPTPDGLLFSDFEMVTAGPVEWDLALLPPEHTAAYDRRAAELGLRPTDPRVRELLDAGRMVQVLACLALVPDLPMLAEALVPMVDRWRALPDPVVS
ncbi:aminoglycoside phosphotransferase family protein [Actinokineospora sp. NPDC004072]